MGQTTRFEGGMEMVGCRPRRGLPVNPRVLGLLVIARVIIHLVKRWNRLCACGRDVCITFTDVCAMFLLAHSVREPGEQDTEMPVITVTSV